MSEKMMLWDRLKVTDPAAVKQITGKPYKGSSPRPFWIVEMLTHEFGPCGIGWGFEIVSERLENLGDVGVLHYAQVRAWIKTDGGVASATHIGGTKVAYHSKSGFIFDEDAPKKSVTDAMVKAFSYLGVCADIFGGRWDDSTYHAEASAHWEQRLAPRASPEQVAEMEALCDRKGVPSERVVSIATNGAGAALTDLTAKSAGKAIEWLAKKADKEPQS